ncbi:MAG: acylphosphatase [Patescibacteria group bacterium]|nr:acylphosphatase [Patescibacteria group bacterium]
MSNAAFHAIVSGRVQLVMYRDFTQRNARRLGIVGEVANLPDGTVRVIAEGEQKALDAFLARLWKGSLLARVDNVRIDKREPGGTFKSFTINFHP